MSKYAVKTLYPDGVESPYRAVALPMFASLCLTVGALLVLAAFLPDMDMPFVQGLREDAKQQVHKLRYGEETQPDGELAKAAMLHSNDVTVEAVWAARDELYLPGSTSELRGAKAKENSRDSTNKARGLCGARRYGVSELSGSRPAELTVAEEWVNDPETPAQQTYLANEAVYRSFVYDNYTEVSDALLPTLDRLFWDGYSGENDGIYSAVSRVREVLRNQMTYAETPAAAPGGGGPSHVVPDRGTRGQRGAVRLGGGRSAPRPRHSGAVLRGLPAGGGGCAKRRGKDDFPHRRERPCVVRGVL